MSFATPLGLIALLALPAILILHLFRRRFRERRVAGLFLFVPDALPAAAGRTRTRLLRTPSLWLELLAALCLALLLGGLAFGRTASTVHLVAVVDASASMAAGAEGDRPIDRARAWLDRELDALPDDARVTLITTGRRPDVVAGPEATPALARAALADLRCDRPGHDPLVALELGLDLADDGGRLLFVTDAERPEPPPRYRHLGFGRALPNAALLAARRVVRGDEERIFADLLAFAPRPIDVEIVVEVGEGGAGKEVVRRRSTLDPASTLHLAWTLPRTPLPVRVRIEGDLLDADNHVLLLPSPTRIVPVRIDLDPQTAGLLRLERVLTAATGSHVVGAGEPYTLRFGSEPKPAATGRFQVLVNAPGDDRDDWIGPYLLERRRAVGGLDTAPLLEGITLDGVIWSSGRTVLPGLPLVLAGDVALVSEEGTPRGPILHVNLDPARSNLPSSPDWPILITNVLASARARLPGPVETNVRIGEEIAYRTAAGEASGSDAAGRLVLVDPDGGRLPARGYDILTWDARRVGLHRLLDGEQEVARFAVSFIDPSESDLGSCSTFDHPAVATTSHAGRGRDVRESRTPLLLGLLALAFVIADMVVLGRRS